LMLKNSFGTDAASKIHEDERLEACDEKHRIWSLENQFLKYQFFKSEETSEEEANKRKTDLWGILDDYYEKLSDELEETESDKDWRLFLARMDSRKMHPTVEATDNGVLINFNPEIEPTLEKYREKS